MTKRKPQQESTPLRDRPRPDGGRVSTDDRTDPGTVYLVGAGPGDPRLLTLRGRDLLLACDAVVYDRLAAPALPPDLPPEVELHYVGKRADKHTLPQVEINALLVCLAREGKQVCRFKGGDPFVFGRGGEEAEALRQAGIPFEIVPGVTAGIAAAAYAGIPVTHRGEAIRVTLITAHEDPTKPAGQVDWQWLGSDPHGTITAYMPVANLPAVVAALLAGGLDPATPAAVIERGTLPSQRTITASLADLPATVQEADVRPPALLVIGKTVALGEKLAWIEERPLRGRRVVVTRPADQASRLITALQELGVEPLVCPVIQTERAEASELVPFVGDLAGYDWIFFTSENGVRHFFAMLWELGHDLRLLATARFAAIGSGTAERLASHGLSVDFLPSTFQSDVMLKEFLERGGAEGLRILRVRGDNAPTNLEDGLRAAGAAVDTVLAYRVGAARVRPEVEEEIGAVASGHGHIDAVTFTSASTVASFERLLPAHQLHARAPAVCIGPLTAAAATQAGWREVVTARENTIAGLVDVLRDRLDVEK
jgi:uroporphyrinogen III methyltransferase/synthase